MSTFFGFRNRSAAVSVRDFSIRLRKYIWITLLFLEKRWGRQGLWVALKLTQRGFFGTSAWYHSFQRSDSAISRKCCSTRCTAEHRSNQLILIFLKKLRRVPETPPATLDCPNLPKHPFESQPCKNSRYLINDLLKLKNLCLRKNKRVSEWGKEMGRQVKRAIMPKHSYTSHPQDTASNTQRLARTNNEISVWWL